MVELLLFGVVTWPTLIWWTDMSAIGAWKLKLEAGGFLPVAGSTDGASPIKHTTDILSRDGYVYKVTCLVSYTWGITHITGQKFGVKKVTEINRIHFPKWQNFDEKYHFRKDDFGRLKRSFSRINSRNENRFFKLNMSRTIDVLSEPDSNSNHWNNVFAEPMTHPRTGGCYIPDNH